MGGLGVCVQEGTGIYVGSGRVGRWWMRKSH